jgi:hypothetical protein
VEDVLDVMPAAHAGCAVSYVKPEKPAEADTPKGDEYCTTCTSTTFDAVPLMKVLAKVTPAGAGSTFAEARGESGDERQG